MQRQTHQLEFLRLSEERPLSPLFRRLWSFPSSAFSLETQVISALHPSLAHSALGCGSFTFCTQSSEGFCRPHCPARSSPFGLTADSTETKHFVWVHTKSLLISSSTPKEAFRTRFLAQAAFKFVKSLQLQSPKG